MKLLFALVLNLCILQAQIKQVKIGNQVWMLENLDVEKFRNGDNITEAKTNEEWTRAIENGEPAWCYYDNNPANGVKYGKLYNWFAVNDPRGLAPSGWHVPNNDDWTMLINYLGGEEKAISKMKSQNGWRANGNGTNDSGFSGLPGGYRYLNGIFDFIGFNGFWWSFTEDPKYKTWYRNLDYKEEFVPKFHNKFDGLSVRCIKD